MVVPSVRRDGGVMITLRRLSVTLLAFLLVPALSVPAHAAPQVLTSWIVTFGQVPSGHQVDVLRGVSDAVHGFSELPAAVVVAPAGAAPLLRALPGVRGVYPNTTYRYLADAATTISKASRVWSDLGWTGAGVGIAVIDAGVDGSHPDLCAAPVFCNGTPVKVVQNVKVLGRQDVAADPVVYLENQISTDSTSGHGSHVAGIAGGWGSAGTDPTRYRGVAYGSHIVGYGTGEVVEAVNVLGAFDHALAHREEYNLKVINNSWGPGAFTPYDPEDPVNLAIDAAWNAGVSVVFGAGNDGTRTDSLNMFSANPHAISVGGGRKDGQQAFFSSKGVPGHPQLHPTVTAPGDVITSVRARTGFTMVAAGAGDPQGTDVDAAQGSDQVSYVASSGTSMASPHVAGVVALMQQAAKATRGRWLTPLEVRNVLQNTATPMVGYQQYSVGAGFVNALAATQAAMAGTQTQTYDNHLVTDVRPFAGSVGPAAYLSTSTFDATYTVLPGATSLDVMIDWGPEKVLPANTDVDLDLIRPDGSTFDTTFLRCDPTLQPNGYSSFCSSAPNERLSVVNPVPGTWRAFVHGGLAEVSDAVRGLWSVTYPTGTDLPAPAVGVVALQASAPASLTGQPIGLTAQVRDSSGLPLPDRTVTWGGSGVGALGHVTAVTDTYGRARAQALSGAPGGQTVTVQAGSSLASVSLTWLGVAVPALPALPSCLLACPAPVTDSNGKVSGGGWWKAGSAKHHLAASAEHAAGQTGVSGDLSYDDKAGTKITGDGVEHLVIDGTTATVTGACSVNGSSGYRYTLTVVDNGEPGSSDTARLVVTRPGSPWRLDDGGTLSGGNVQVKPA